MPLLQKDSPIQITFSPNNGIPNHPTWPVLLYKNIFNSDEVANPGRLRALLTQNQWTGFWRWSVYAFHHYHSNANESLICLSGHARIQLGGRSGEQVEVSKGDAVVLPAGTGHCRKISSEDFEMLGAYPEGQQNYDLLREDEIPIEVAMKRINAVSKPAVDPYFGADGPLIHIWE